MDQDHHIRVWAGRYFTEVIAVTYKKGGPPKRPALFYY